VALLLERGATVPLEGEARGDCILAACRHGHMDCAMRVLRHWPQGPAFEDVSRAALLMACQRGHEGCMRLLCARGVSISANPLETMDDPVFARDPTFAGLFFLLHTTPTGQQSLDWLKQAQAPGPTPLHRIRLQEDEEAVECLVRGGADLHAPGGIPAAPTPVDVARELEHDEDHGNKARLVLRAAEPWSPHNHRLFPAGARARAVELCLVGCQLALDETHFPLHGAAFKDVWLRYILPNALDRNSAPGGGTAEPAPSPVAPAAVDRSPPAAAPAESEGATEAGQDSAPQSLSAQIMVLSVDYHGVVTSHVTNLPTG